MALTDLMSADVPDRRPRLLTFRSGGWVVLLALLICTMLIAWAIAPAVLRIFHRPPGDGQNVESYGFDLSTCLVDRATMVPATLYRDMVPVMDDPAVMPGSEVARKNEQQRGKFLVSADRVVGVELNGAARAYPVSVLTVHEIINDTLGGVPIAVTYHWPCDSVMVFDRRVDGQTLRFGHSGLVFNSNLLMYDRQSGADPVAPQPQASLWLQLEARAVAGPAAADGRSLTLLRSSLVDWSTWMQRHPATTVVIPDPVLGKRYAKANPSSYFRGGRIAFPVEPQPPADGPDAFERVLVVTVGGARRVYPDSLIETLADADGTWTDTLAGTLVRFTRHAPGTAADKNQPPTVEVQAVDGSGPDDLLVLPSLWFAWHAMHPQDEPASADNDSSR